VKTFGAGSITTIQDRDQNAIGRAVVQGNVDLSTEVPLSTGLLNLFTSRIMWLIIPLIALEVYLIYKIRSDLNLTVLSEGYRSVRDFLGQVPVKLKLERISPHTQDQDITASQPNSFEFGFFIRLGVKNVIRNFQAKIELHSQKESITKSKDSNQE
jgi:hypothetical protein